MSRRGQPAPRNVMKAIKDLPISELQKYKESDIISFVKVGNLAMVHGLIKYLNLRIGAMNLRAPPEEFAINRD